MHLRSHTYISHYHTHTHTNTTNTDAYMYKACECVLFCSFLHFFLFLKSVLCLFFFIKKKRQRKERPLDLCLLHFPLFFLFVRSFFLFFFLLIWCTTLTCAASHFPRSFWAWSYTVDLLRSTCVYGSGFRV